MKHYINVEDAISEYREAKKKHDEIGVKIDGLSKQKETLFQHYNACLQIMVSKLGRQEAYKKQREIDESIESEKPVSKNEPDAKPEKIADAIWIVVEKNENEGMTVDEIKDKLQQWGFDVEGTNTLYSTLHRFSTNGSKGRRLRKVGDKYYA